MESVRQAMQECDSLLRMLQLRGGANDQEAGQSIQPDAEYTVTRQMSKGKLLPCADTQEAAIEELQIHNRALCSNIRDLLVELELKDAEIDQLKQENQSLRIAQRPQSLDKDNSTPSSGKCNFKNLTESEEPLPTPTEIKLDDLLQGNVQLAPLEKPEFDFNSLQFNAASNSAVDDDEECQES